MKELNIGFDAYVMLDKVLVIAPWGSLPMKKLKEVARAQDRLIDVTMGRRTRAVILTESNHVILSGIQAMTLVKERMNSQKLTETS